MVYFVKKLRKNEQLCQNSCNLATPACDYVVAMATLKVVWTLKVVKISARDEWTAPESLSIIE